MNLAAWSLIFRIPTQRSEDTMADKMDIGATFPDIALNVVQAGMPDTTLMLPHAPAARYRTVLFYRGHW